MGLPVGKLICASNKNNVLTDFIKTGTYDARRTFYKTTSPSMDILISSNLERLLLHTSGSAEKVEGWMRNWPPPASTPWMPRRWRSSGQLRRRLRR